MKFKIRRLFKGRDAGRSLLETLIAVALLSTIVVALLGALGTSSKVVLTDDKLTVIQNIAESQMEYLWSQQYDDTNNPPLYAVLSGLPDGYSISYTASQLDPEGDGSSDDDGLQKIVLNIEYGGITVRTLEAYKYKR